MSLSIFFSLFSLSFYNEKRNITKKKYCICFSVFLVPPYKVCSLKHLAKITFINTVDHRERIKTLSLPKRIKNELLRDYSKYLNFDSVVKLNIWDEKATSFMMLEDKIKYGTVYPRKFMCIVKSNPWIRETFNTFSHEWHFVHKCYMHIEKNGKHQFVSSCDKCFEGDPQKKYMVHNWHVVRTLSFKQLFEQMFSESAWCSICKLSPLYEMLPRLHCRHKYGMVMHDCCNDEIGCWSCRKGSLLTKDWYTPL